MSKESELMAAVEAIIDDAADSEEQRNTVRTNLLHAMTYLQNDLIDRVPDNDLTDDDRLVLVALIQREINRYWERFKETEN